MRRGRRLAKRSISIPSRGQVPAGANALGQPFLARYALCVRHRPLSAAPRISQPIPLLSRTRFRVRRKPSRRGRSDNPPRGCTCLLVIALTHGQDQAARTGIRAGFGIRHCWLRAPATTDVETAPRFFGDAAAIWIRKAVDQKHGLNRPCSCQGARTVNPPGL